MLFSDYLAAEWTLALGCTEPAAIAHAAANAAAQARGEIRSVALACDPRVYKNCYAVGIPHSDHKIGLRWALAIGACLPDPTRGLECFGEITPEILAQAERLVAADRVSVSLLRDRNTLYIDCRVERAGGTGRAVIERDHTRLTRLERDGVPVPVGAHADAATECGEVRARLATMPFAELIEFARTATAGDRASLRRGIELNLAIAQHGLNLLPERFIRISDRDPLSRTSALVCAGVYARMWGEDFPVVALAGSGNKGITCAVPLVLWGRERGLSEARVLDALALAALVTSSTTHHLGTLSAVCGCSNAAGIGLAAGLVLLDGGGPEEISLAIHNMVGNVTGMICDGAKIGCALKTMTAVDAAFRSAFLATSGVGIPYTDGIVGVDGMASLTNLGRIASRGMASTDDEILRIMEEKLV